MGGGSFLSISLAGWDFSIKPGTVEFRTQSFNFLLCSVIYAFTHIHTHTICIRPPYTHTYTCMNRIPNFKCAFHCFFLNGYYFMHVGFSSMYAWVPCLPVPMLCAYRGQERASGTIVTDGYKHHVVAGN